MDPDLSLVHCVELHCFRCEGMIRVARCQCDLDADHLVEVYRRDILLYTLCCPKCGQPYKYESISRVNRVEEGDEPDHLDEFELYRDLSLNGEAVSEEGDGNAL